jgi:hypothetical protein
MYPVPVFGQESGVALIPAIDIRADEDRRFDSSRHQVSHHAHDQLIHNGAPGHRGQRADLLRQTLDRNRGIAIGNAVVDEHITKIGELLP